MNIFTRRIVWLMGWIRICDYGCQSTWSARRLMYYNAGVAAPILIYCKRALSWWAKKYDLLYSHSIFRLVVGETVMGCEKTIV